MSVILTCRAALWRITFLNPVHSRRIPVNLHLLLNMFDRHEIA